MTQQPKNGNSNWFRPDRVDALWWGLAFILGAFVLLVENSGWADASGWWDARGVFFIGAGSLALFCAAIRLQMPAYRTKWAFSAIFGIFFLAIGLGAWDAAWWIWVVGLMGVGVLILATAFHQGT